MNTPDTPMDPTRTAPAHPPISSSCGNKPQETLLQRGAFDPPFTPGTLGKLDRFEILRLIGEGGMGQVYLAREPLTDTQVAIKIMKPQAADDPQAVHRFLTEARHMYRLAHPRILRVLEVSDRPAGPYYVMPYIAGGSLLARCKPGETLPETEVLSIARQVAEALAHAHSHGLIHRDLKPGNVLLDKDGNAFLTDFGLVRTLFNDSMVDASASHLEGTAPYMSPAVARGEAEDTRCDIYAFGALLYEMLTGQPPYSGRSAQMILDQVLRGPPKPIREVNPKANAALVKIAEGCLARELRDRYASMADVVADLEHAAQGKAPFGPHRQRGQRLPRLAALAAAAVVVAGLTWAAVQFAPAFRVSRDLASGVGSPASPKPPPEPPSEPATPTLWDGPFGYTVADGKATIVKYNGQGGDVTISETIKGLPVTAIGHSAFADCRSLTNVWVPASVTATAKFAFNWCVNLKGIYFSGDAPQDEQWFGNTKAVVYYRSDTKGWRPEFGGRPTAVWEEEAPAVPPGAEIEGPFAYTTAFGAVSIRRYTGPGGKVSVPGTIKGMPVTSINTHAFAGCTGLTSVVVAPGITSIGGYAFRGCTALRTVELPETVTMIGDSTFRECRSLTAVTIPPNVTALGSWVFGGCTSLTAVAIPPDITNIPANAFYNCVSLKAVAIPSSVTRIGLSAFRECQSLSEVTIPVGVTALDAWAFSGCTSLTSVSIPMGVTNVAYSAFRNCSSLGSVLVAAGVETLGGHVFAGCSGLAEVRFGGDAPTVDATTFVGADNATIYYRPGTKGWGPTFGGRPTKVWEEGVAGAAAAGPVTGLYMVVDLSGGTRATRYQVTSLDDVPKGGWTDEYKTDKLVLRRIEPGTFVMGSPTNEVSRDPGRETQHPVKLTKPFYVGVFEVTQRQWERVMGTRPSYFDNPADYATRPVQSVSHNMIRGAVESLKWPASNVVDADSFLGRLRTRAGLDFELPTDAQWEYACRAGTTTSFNNGKNLLSEEGPCPGLEKIARHAHNSGSLDGTCTKESDASKGTAKVGTYEPNPWGLYDMHGNVYEWVVDWWAPITNTAAVTDPVGPDRGGCKIVRGGAWTTGGTHCRSAIRPGSRNCGNASTTFGFRLAAPAVRPARVAVGPAVLPFTWTTDDNAVTITKYIGLGGEVEVPEKIEGVPVTVIGPAAFDNCRHVTQVSLPATLTTIRRAFQNCSGLTHIVIPDSVTRIEGSAFARCTSLTNVTLSAGLTAIEAGTFQGCVNLANIAIPQAVNRIDYVAFSGCSALRTLRIPAVVMTIMPSAFAGCTSLTAFQVDPANAAFRSNEQGDILGKDGTMLWRCPPGKGGRYTVPDGVTKIGDAAFSSNTSLTDVDIHAGVTRIGVDAFANCTNLTAVTIPEGVVEIGYRAFIGCSGITRFNIPASVTRLWSDTFAGVTRLAAIDVAAANTAFCSEGGVLFNKAKTLLFRYPPGKAGHYTVPKGVSEIGGSAFSHSDLLTGVTIPGTVLRIGPDAFTGCDVLSDVRIEEGVAHIDNCAFRDCPQLQKIVLPASVVAMGPNPFQSCESLTAITVDPANTVYSSDAEGVVFDKEKEVLITYPSGRPGHYEIPDGVVKIRETAFAHANKLTSVAFPTSVERLEHAPFGSFALRAICFRGDSPQLARPDVFAAPRYATIYYPPRAKGWGKEFGGRPTAVGEVKGPFLVADNRGTLTVIRYLGAGGEVVIPAMVEGVPVGTVGREAFKNSASVTSLTVPGSVLTIDSSAFAGCAGLTNLVLRAGVSRIADGAFSGCSGLKSVTLPASLSDFKVSAFDACMSLEAIHVDERNPNFKSVDGCVLSKDGAIYCPKGRHGALALPGGMRTVSIGSFAVPTEGSFGYTTNSGSATIVKYTGPGGRVTIPDQIKGMPVTVIDGAFCDCTNLTSVTIPRTVTKIASFSFSSCTSLTNVVIPASVTNMGSSPFIRCSALTKIGVDAQNPSYVSEDGVVFSKDKTTLIAFPAGKTGSYVVPDGVTKIDGNAFRDCHGLTSVTLPPSVQTVMFSAFSRCPSLTDVYFGGDAPALGQGAFNFCNTTVYYRPGTKGWGPEFGGRPTKVWEEDERVRRSDGGKGQ